MKVFEITILMGTLRERSPVAPCWMVPFSPLLLKYGIMSSTTLLCWWPYNTCNCRSTNRRTAVSKCRVTCLRVARTYSGITESSDTFRGDNAVNSEPVQVIINLTTTGNARDLLLGARNVLATIDIIVCACVTSQHYNELINCKQQMRNEGSVVVCIVFRLYFVFDKSVYVPTNEWLAVNKDFVATREVSRLWFSFLTASFVNLWIATHDTPYIITMLNIWHFLS